MSRKQIRKRLFTVSKEKKSLALQTKKLKKQLELEIQKNGLNLDDSSHQLISEISTSAGDSFSEGSVMKLLWQEQKKTASYKSSKSMRWHPVIIRWCLSIYLHSPGKEQFANIWWLSKL